MKISIVIPVYNEVKRIDQLLNCLKNYCMVNHLFSFEFIIVDDGSTDETYNKITHFLENESDLNIELQGYKTNQGKGLAVNYGFLKASSDAEYIGFMDADLATPLEHIDLLYPILNLKKYNLVIGDRNASKEKYDSFLRSFASFIFHCIAHLPLKNTYKDTQAGFKFYHKDLAFYISQNALVNDFSFDVEHLLLNEINKGEVFEYPINNWQNGDDSKVNVFKDSFKMLNTILKMVSIKHLTNYYVNTNSEYQTILVGEKNNNKKKAG